MSAFYPGAGLDITPIVLREDIKDWYYMDSQPMSEFGSLILPGYERPNFTMRLKKIMSQIGMNCMSETQHSLFFFNPNTKCKVTYYINSVFPKALDYCYLPCTIFVACGYSLDGRPPHFMKHFSQIICNNKTYYDDAFLKECEHAEISTIKWDDVEEYFLDENRTREFIMQHTKI